MCVWISFGLVIFACSLKLTSQYKFNCHGFNRSRETERWRPGSIAKCWWMLKMPAAEAWACHLPKEI